MIDAESSAALTKCAFAVVEGSTAEPIDLSMLDRISMEMLNSLTEQVEAFSDRHHTVRIADNDLFGGFEPIEPCAYLARVGFSAYEPGQNVEELTDDEDDILLFRLKATTNGLQIPAIRRKPYIVERLRARAVELLRIPVGIRL